MISSLFKRSLNAIYRVFTSRLCAVQIPGPSIYMWLADMHAQKYIRKLQMVDYDNLSTLYKAPRERSILCVFSLTNTISEFVCQIIELKQTYLNDTFASKIKRNAPTNTEK